MKEEVLRFRSLMKAANEGKLFSDIEMQVCKGEIIGLRSDNNGIAQALLRIIAGTDRPNSGSVYIDGARYAFDDAATLLRNVVYTFDHVEEFSPELSVLDVFTVAGGAIDKDFHDMRKREALFEKTLEKYHYPNYPADRKVSTLNILDKCMLSLLRACLRGCQLIILNDVSGFLNEIDRQNVMNVIEKFQQNGMSFIMLDHEQNMLKAYVNRLYYLKGGITAYVLDDLSEVENFVRIAEASEKESKNETGRKECKSTYTKGTALSILNLNARNLDNFSLRVDRGEIVGIMDLTSYAGQEIVDVLSGQLVPRSGQIYLNSVLYKPSGYHKSIKRGLCFISENPIQNNGMLFHNMTVMDNIMLTLSEKDSMIFNSKFRKSVQARCEELFHKDIADCLVSRLDEIDQLKLVYYKMLLYYPGVIVCVHPFSGANVSMQDTTEWLIRECANQGIAVLILSNGVREAYNISDRIVSLS